MNSGDERRLRDAFNEGFKTVRRDGVFQGAVAICKVILNKANAPGKTAEERLSDIVEFCETSLKNKK